MGTTSDSVPARYPGSNCICYWTANQGWEGKVECSLQEDIAKRVEFRAHDGDKRTLGLGELYHLGIAAAIGDRCWAYWTKEKKWANPGVVTRRRGRELFITYDDGDTKWVPESWVHKAVAMAESREKICCEFTGLALVRPQSDLAMGSKLRKTGAIFYEQDPIPAKTSLHQVRPQFPESTARAETEAYARVSERTTWRRMAPNEALFRGEGTGGVSVGDIRQKNVGDCWLMGAVASVANKHPETFCEQEGVFNATKLRECGCLSVRLFVDHRPRWVLLDDFFPVDSASGEPKFVRSADKGELWPVFLEKAFAKWAGCYQNLRGGLQNCVTPIGSKRALAAFLPGNTEYVERYLKNDTNTDWSYLRSLSEKGYLMTCGGATPINGLTSGHVFSILELVETRLPGGPSAFEGDFLPSLSEASAPRLLHLENPTGKGIWFRHHHSGGWTGSDISGDTREYDYTIKRDDGVLKWMFYDGSQTSFAPVEELAVKNGCTIRFGAGGSAQVLQNQSSRIVSQVRESPAGKALASSDVLRLVKLRNPWGSGEWNGLWSDGSPIWKAFPSVAESVGLQNAEDGTFFMQWEDFHSAYEYVMATGNPDSS